MLHIKNIYEPLSHQFVRRFKFSENKKKKGEILFKKLLSPLRKRSVSDRPASCSGKLKKYPTKILSLRIVKLFWVFVFLWRSFMVQEIRALQILFSAGNGNHFGIH